MLYNNLAGITIYQHWYVFNTNYTQSGQDACALRDSEVDLGSQKDEADQEEIETLRVNYLIVDLPIHLPEVLTVYILLFP